MKYIHVVLLTLFLMTACSDQNPLQVAQEKEPLDLIPYAPREVPFHADLHNSIATLPPFPPPIIHALFEGGGTATHLGQVILFSTSEIDVTTDQPWQQTGTAVLTSAAGDELHFDYAGTATQDASGFITFSGDSWFMGGTGRFSNATGEGTYAGTGQGNPDGTGEGQWEVDGQISR